MANINTDSSASSWGLGSVKDWLIRLILDALKVDGVFSILPYEPTIGVGVGPRVGTVRITCDLEVGGDKGHSEWVGDPGDVIEKGPLVILRQVQEEAIALAFEAYKNRAVKNSLTRRTPH